MNKNNENLNSIINKTFHKIFQSILQQRQKFPSIDDIDFEDKSVDSIIETNDDFGIDTYIIQSQFRACQKQIQLQNEKILKFVALEYSYCQKDQNNQNRIVTEVWCLEVRPSPNQQNRQQGQNKNQQQFQQQQVDNRLLQLIKTILVLLETLPFRGIIEETSEIEIVGSFISQNELKQAILNIATSNMNLAQNCTNDKVDSSQCIPPQVPSLVMLLERIKTFDLNLPNLFYNLKTQQFYDLYFSVTFSRDQLQDNPQTSLQESQEQENIFSINNVQDMSVNNVVSLKENQNVIIKQKAHELNLVQFTDKDLIYENNAIIKQQQYIFDEVQADYYNNETNNNNSSAFSHILYLQDFIHHNDYVYNIPLSALQAHLRCENNAEESDTSIMKGVYIKIQQLNGLKIKNTDNLQLDRIIRIMKYLRNRFIYYQIKGMHKSEESVQNSAANLISAIKIFNQSQIQK